MSGKHKFEVAIETSLQKDVLRGHIKVHLPLLDKIFIMTYILFNFAFALVKKLNIEDIQILLSYAICSHNLKHISLITNLLP